MASLKYMCAVLENALFIQVAIKGKDMCEMLKPQEDCRAVCSLIALLENPRRNIAENQLQGLVWSEIF